MNKGITVRELQLMCVKAMADGYGDRHIQISGDDEGNSFHSLFYGFTDNSDKDIDYFISEGLMPYGIDSADDIIVLG